MSVYNHSNVAVTGGSSTYVAGDLNHIAVLEQRNGPAAFERLCQYITPNALHNSGEVSDQPKCHPGTRVAIRDYLFAWAAALIYTYPIIWLHGPAGAGKSAILRTIAQRLYHEKLLLASFFFFRTGERRNTSEHVIATIAYQLALSIPETRLPIDKAIERNPVIFSLSLWEQALALIVSPLVSVFYNPSFNSRHYARIIVIDGLDECLDSSKQCEILQVLRRTVESVPIPLAVLVASRPEHHIRAEFNLGDLNECSSRLALDDSYDPDSDIKKYLIDKFDNVRQHHQLKSYLPTLWPSQDIIDKLVAKASGQFIYAATVEKFVSSSRHHPAKRLDIIVGALSVEGLRPFEQLDNLYSTIFCTIEEDLISTLRVLGVLLVPHVDSDVSDGNKAVQPEMHGTRSPAFVERLFDLDRGDVQYLLFNLESLLTVSRSQENIQIFHASLSDYLFDRSRSGQFWIDAELIYADLVEHCVRHLRDWPEIRTFLVRNGSLFFSKAKPTSRLHQALLDGDLDQSDPYWLRKLCPDLLQIIVEKSRFPDAKMLFANQFDNFKRIIAPRIQKVYFSSIPLMSYLVALTFVTVSAINGLMEVLSFLLQHSPDEVQMERAQGFGFFNTLEFSPIMPFIRTLLNDANEGCFLNGDRYADVALYILKPFLDLHQYSYTPTSLLSVLMEVIPPLLLKSSVNALLVRYLERFRKQLRRDRPHILSAPIGPAIEKYLSRQNSNQEFQIMDLTTPPPETQQTGHKRSQRESDIVDLSKETLLPRSKPSSSGISKRARTTGPHVIEAPLTSISSPNSETEWEVGNSEYRHGPNRSYAEDNHVQDQTGEDAEHAITVSDSE